MRAMPAANRKPAAINVSAASDDASFAAGIATTAAPTMAAMPPAGPIEIRWLEPSRL